MISYIYYKLTSYTYPTSVFRFCGNVFEICVKSRFDLCGVKLKVIVVTSCVGYC